MFQKNFDAQKNQDQTTDKFCFAFIFASEEVANDNSDDREYKGCDTNNTNCFNDRSIKKSKRDADCERVDACCNSKNKHVFVINRSICDFDDFFFIPFTDGFNYHFAADETKKDKCDPVVNAGDVLLELAAKKPADERHKCLKSSKIQSDNNGLFFVKFSHSEALTDWKLQRHPWKVRHPAEIIQ